MCLCDCVCVCVVCVYVFEVSDVVLRKLLCVMYLCCHFIDNHGRDLQVSNCAGV